LFCLIGRPLGTFVSNLIDGMDFVPVYIFGNVKYSNLFSFTFEVIY